MNISKKNLLIITAIIIICPISLKLIINAQSSYSETIKETDKISYNNDSDSEPSKIPNWESNDESTVIESTNQNPNNSCDEATSNPTNMNTSNTTNTNTSSKPSLEEKYSALARNVRLEPEGVTVSRYSDQDVDNPAMAGSLLKHKIISEELKITKRCKTEVTNTEKRMLSLIIYHETCSEPYEGKLAAANAILNRVYDTRGYWPNTVKGVLEQEGQFETWKDCHWNETVSQYDSGNFTTDNHLLAIRAIDDALNGTNNIGTRVAWSMYCVVKNGNFKNPVRIQNNLFWDY